MVRDRPEKTVDSARTVSRAARFTFSQRHSGAGSALSGRVSVCGSGWKRTSRRRMSLPEGRYGRGGDGAGYRSGGGEMRGVRGIAIAEGTLFCRNSGASRTGQRRPGVAPACGHPLRSPCRAAAAGISAPIKDCTP